MAEPCSKVAYRNERAARRAARMVGDACAEPFRAYRCPRCRKWHLSSQDKAHTYGSGKGLNRSSHARREPVRTLDELVRRARQLRGDRSE